MNRKISMTNFSVRLNGQIERETANFVTGVVTDFVNSVENGCDSVRLKSFP
jgi:hypothetical protein